MRWKLLLFSHSHNNKAQTLPSAYTCELVWMWMDLVVDATAVKIANSKDSARDKANKRANARESNSSPTEDCIPYLVVAPQTATACIGDSCNLRCKSTAFQNRCCNNKLCFDRRYGIAVSYLSYNRYIRFSGNPFLCAIPFWFGWVVSFDWVESGFGITSFSVRSTLVCYVCSSHIV